MGDRSGGSSRPPKRQRTTTRGPAKSGRTSASTVPVEEPSRKKTDGSSSYQEADEYMEDDNPAPKPKPTRKAQQNGKNIISKAERHQQPSKMSTRLENGGETKVQSSSNAAEQGEADEQADDEYDQGDTAHPGIDGHSKPLSNIKDMIKDIVKRTFNPGKEVGLQACANHLETRPINVATFCSGTESPILAIMMIKKAMFDLDPNCEINFNHLFSAEIVPFKQHYIEANFSPPILFSDITELTKELHVGEKVRTATTAYGGKAIVPGDVDLLVAGFSCVDFSPLNGQRKTLESRGESGDTFFSLREYAKFYRPKAIILENVCGAPWDHAAEVKKGSKINRTGIDLLMGQIGYLTKFVRVDTKDYYLPQTRVRGYMVCIDKTLYSLQNFNPGRDFERWHKYPLPGWILKQNESDPPNKPSKSGEENPRYRQIDTASDESDDIVEGFFDLDKNLKEWAKLVENLKRRASVPVDVMLLRSDDPSLEALITQSNPLPKTKRKTTPWERARIGHHEYRDNLLLGHKRPLTDWVNGGNYIPDDFWKRQQKGMVERVLDTLEIAHLRSLTRGFDDRYYSRPLELSQNVFRVEDTTKPGIVGCLTPTGMPFLTSRGSRIIGLEAITLQGLHLEELDLAMLTQANLQDLAGNAMSSTVVGVMIAAALSVFHQKFEISDRKPTPKPAAIEPGFPWEELLEKHTKFSSDYSYRLSRVEAMEEAKATRRLCACEGRLHYKTTGFQRCTVCLHTTCKQCGVKSLHHYIELSVNELEKRKDPSSFEKLIRDSIPSSISLNFDADELDKCLQHVNADSKLEFHQMVKKAFDSEVYLRTVRRDEYWEIIYDSSAAKLVLTISERKVEWRLFSNVEELGLNTKKGKYFRRYPIAKMCPGDDDINIGSWSFWVPEKHEFNMNLTWSGKPLKTFGAQRGLESMAGDHVYTNCELSITNYDGDYFERDVRGRYNLSQDCGQPQNTLHALQTVETEQPLFFYLEQHLRTGDPYNGDHNFVFTEDTHKLEKLEHRNVIADFKESWRPPLIKVKDHVALEDVRDIKNHTDLVQQKDFQSINKLEDALDIYIQRDRKIVVQGRWVGSVSFSMNSTTKTQLTYRTLSALSTLPALSTSCEFPTLAVLAFEANLTGEITGSWSKGVWTLINQANESRFMEEFGWALRQGSVCVEHTQAISSWLIIDAEVKQCLKCSPQPPPLLWSRNIKNKAIPCEEPIQATKYEKALKARPRGLVAKFFITDQGKVLFKVGVNPYTLIHRAVALLSSTSSITEATLEFTTSWRLVTDEDTNPNVRYNELTIVQNSDCPGKIVVPGFKKKLRPEQDRALVWATAQDNGQKPFVEEEVVEARLDCVGYRVEGKASRQVNCRGGLLFFDVGFGKTAIALALARYFLEADTVAAHSLLETHPPRDTGKIPLRATLIIVPGHLTKQWATEAEKFLGLKQMKSGSRILVIGLLANLKSKTVQDFKDADIIIVSWKFLTGSAYHTSLAHLAGIVERDETSNRAKSLWYDKAKLRLSETVKSLHQDDLTPPMIQNGLSEEYEKDSQECDKVDAPVPTKRTRGRAYKPVAERETPVASGKRKRNSSEAHPRKEQVEEMTLGRFVDEQSSRDQLDDEASGIKTEKVVETAAVQQIRDCKTFNMTKISSVNEMKCPLLEMFSFARVFIDEFTYLFDEPLALQMVNNLAAPSKFALSGTPNLASFSTVKELADILGIHLGRDDFASMKSEEFAQATKDMSNSELFLTYQSAASTAWHINRQGVAQNFLDTFARKDEADVDDIRCEKHYTLVDIHPAQKAIYLELQQRVASSTFENLRCRNVNSEVERQIQDVICGSDDPKQALLIRASHVKLETDVQDAGEPREPAHKSKSSGDTKPAVEAKQLSGRPVSIQSLIAIRETQYENLKKDMAHQLGKAMWLQNEEDAQTCPNFQTWIERVKDGGFHDNDCRDDILALIDRAEQAYTKDDWMNYYLKTGETEARKQLAKQNNLQKYPMGKNKNTNTAHLSQVEAHLRATTTHISKQTEVIVSHKRSMRLMQAIEHIQNTLSRCSGCHQILMKPEDVTILGACGHVMCPLCLISIGYACPLGGCHVEIREFEKVKGSEFHDLVRCDNSPNSRKADAIIEVIKKAQGRGEKVLLFVQFRKLANMLMEAMSNEKILFADMTALVDKANTLETFQRESDDATVLVMDPIGESAAGANLTNANHIIFATPLYTSGLNAQYRYRSTVTQAIGRSRRYGQTKTVHVHYFLSVNTIDIDLFQHRQGKILHRDPNDASVGILVDRTPGVQSTLHSAIAHINYTGEPMTD